MKKLFSFYWECGREGSVEGNFVADEADLNSAIGKKVVLGDVLGKYSWIEGNLELSDIFVVSVDQEKIQCFESLFPNGTGYNPLDYIEQS